MSEERTWSKLVELAQRGQGNCMDRLAEQARGRLCAYVYRVTLDHEITEDITQETLLEMMESLFSILIIMSVSGHGYTV